MQTNKVSLWMGREIIELSREEMIEALEWCGKELTRLYDEQQKLFKAVDPIKYLMQKD